MRRRNLGNCNGSNGNEYRIGGTVATVLKTAWTALICVLLGLAGPAQSFEVGILDSVVAVIPEWPGYPRASQAPGAPEHPEGTATAVFPGGYVVTNAHVLGAAERIRVRLTDGAVFDAEIVGRDVPTDLALLQVPVDLPVLTPAEAPSLGGKVCAIGNQFGMGPSVTCGVVSALGVSGAGFNPIEDFIQTDAAVNPGGSGGALVNGEGHLVGVVSAIFTKKSDANIGINFAASMKLVHRVAEDLRDHGRVIRGKQGFGVLPARAPGTPGPGGVIVAWVEPGSSAEKAGLKKGDRIRRIGNRQIRKSTDTIAAVHMFRPGDRFEVEVAGGTAGRVITITLGE